MTRPELRADARQRSQVRVELHHAIDAIIDHWPNIALEAEASVFASRGDSGGGCGPANPTLISALAGDPNRDWLSHFAEMRGHIRIAAARALDLDPPKAKNTRRGAGIEICVKCELPAVGRLVRVDGAPIHRDTCYHQAWRQAQKEHRTVGAVVKELADRLRTNEVVV